MICSLKRISFREFAGDPVVGTLCFHCREHEFSLWLGNEDPTSQAAWPPQKNKPHLHFYIFLDFCMPDLFKMKCRGNYNNYLLLRIKYLKLALIILKISYLFREVYEVGAWLQIQDFSIFFKHHVEFFLKKNYCQGLRFRNNSMYIVRQL